MGERPREDWQGSSPGLVAEFPAPRSACRHADATSSARTSESQPDASAQSFQAAQLSPHSGWTAQAGTAG